MEKIEKQQYLSGHKRKALDTDESAELQSIIKYLINIVEELRDENLMLHKQMDAVCQDVESMKCLLERDLPKTNYTSTNNNNVQVEEKKDKEKETIHEDDILVMIEDKDNDKDKEKDKEKSCNNNNNNNNINNKSGWEAEVKKKIEEEKNRKAKKRHPCENCKRWSHKIDTCWRKHPEIAPLDWKKKAEELKKAAEERKKYEEDMDFRSSLAWASASKKDKIVRTKPIRPEMEEWEEGRRRFEEDFKKEMEKEEIQRPLRIEEGSYSPTAVPFWFVLSLTAIWVILTSLAGLLLSVLGLPWYCCLISWYVQGTLGLFTHWLGHTKILNSFHIFKYWHNAHMGHHIADYPPHKFLTPKYQAAKIDNTKAYYVSMLLNPWVSMLLIPSDYWGMALFLVLWFVGILELWLADKIHTQIHQKGSYLEEVPGKKTEIQIHPIIGMKKFSGYTRRSPSEASRSTSSINYNIDSSKNNNNNNTVYNRISSSSSSSPSSSSFTPTSSSSRSFINTSSRTSVSSSTSPTSSTNNTSVNGSTSSAKVTPLGAMKSTKSSICLTNLSSTSSSNKVPPFGARLDPASPLIPSVVLELVTEMERRNALNIEGIFRLSGKLAEVDILRKQINELKRVDFSKVKDAHVLSNLLKRYFRELQEPLCLFENYDCFVAAVATPDVNQRVEVVKTVLQFLPYPHKVLLKYIISFLIRVVEKSAVNKMDAVNIAVVFAPTILRAPDNEPVPDPKAAAKLIMEYTPHSNKLVEILIDKFDYLLRDFPDPLTEQELKDMGKRLGQIFKEEEKRAKQAKAYKEKMYKDRERAAMENFRKEMKMLGEMKKQAKIQETNKKDPYEYSVDELLAILKKNNINATQCTEKYELVDLANPYL